MDGQLARNTAMLALLVALLEDKGVLTRDDVSKLFEKMPTAAVVVREVG